MFFIVPNLKSEVQNIEIGIAIKVSKNELGKNSGI